MDRRKFAIETSAAAEKEGDEEKIINDPRTGRIIAAAIEVHRCLGPGLLESIYEDALCIEFDTRGIPYQRQVDVVVYYKGRAIKPQRIDLLVDNQIVVELKSVSQLHDAVFSQVLSYLKATGLKHGLIINFGLKRLVDGIKRVSN